MNKTPSLSSPLPYFVIEQRRDFTIVGFPYGDPNNDDYPPGVDCKAVLWDADSDQRVLRVFSALHYIERTDMQGFERGSVFRRIRAIAECRGKVTVWADLKKWSTNTYAKAEDVRQAVSRAAAAAIIGDTWEVLPTRPVETTPDNNLVVFERLPADDRLRIVPPKHRLGLVRA